MNNKTNTRINIDNFLSTITPKINNKIIADIGCGKNKWVKENWEHITKEIYYIDKKETSISNYIWNSENPPPKDITEYFDIVLLKEVLEHSLIPSTMLKNIKDILKNDSELIITSPFAYHTHGRPDDDYFRFTEHWFTNVLKSLSFKNIKIQIPEYLKDLEGGLIPCHYFITATK